MSVVCFIQAVIYNIVRKTLCDILKINCIIQITVWITEHKLDYGKAIIAGHFNVHIDILYSSMAADINITDS